MSVSENSRRAWLKGMFAAAGASVLAGCNKLSENPAVRQVLASSEALTRKTQRVLLKPQPLAPEYTKADLSKVFKANGSTDPQDAAYLALVEKGFADWRLKVDGLVEHPLALSLSELRAMPSRTQITRHDCVEGWSCIGEWTGVPLAHVLDLAGLKETAQYLVFHCMDSMDGSDEDAQRYYESIDLADAHHPQTLLAYAMNGEPLTVPHGAPLRLRVERQLGYKHAKYLARIEAVDRLDHIHGGKGGYWEDSTDYAWYAGI